MNPKIALQLWSVKEDCQKDFKNALKEVKEAGYAGVEFAGYYDMPTEELKAYLDEIGLEVAGSHVPYEKLANDYEVTIAYEKVIGNTRVAVPYMTFPGDFSAWKQFISELKVLSEKLQAEGMTLYYHNHSHEFKEVEGVDLLDYMVKEVPALKLEVDLYWLHDAELPVNEWLDQHQANIGLFHVKEMQENPRESTEIGKGILPIVDYVKKAQAFDLPWLIVEQEAFQALTPMEAVKEDYLALAQIIEGVL